MFLLSLFGRRWYIRSAICTTPVRPRRAKQESTTATRLEEERKGRQKRQQEADDDEEEEESDEESRAKDANLRRFLTAWARRLRWAEGEWGGSRVFCLWRAS